MVSSGGIDSPAMCLINVWGKDSTILSALPHGTLLPLTPQSEAAMSTSRTERTRFSTGWPWTSLDMTPLLVVRVAAGPQQKSES